MTTGKIQKEDLRRSIVEAARHFFEEQKKQQQQDKNHYRTAQEQDEEHGKAPGDLAREKDHQDVNVIVNNKKERHEVDLVAPISPSPNGLISSVVSRLCLDVQSLVLDLGCGDGRWMIEASKQSGGCKCVGFDIDTDRLNLARQAIQRENLCKGITVKRGDLFDIALTSPLISKADLIIVYLFRDALKRLTPILKKRLDPLSDNNHANERDCHQCPQNKRTRILSIGFSLRGFQLLWHETYESLPVYLYQA
jgi:tRNA G46 methylase TrmB